MLNLQAYCLKEVFWYILIILNSKKEKGDADDSKELLLSNSETNYEDKVMNLDNSEEFKDIIFDKDPESAAIQAFAKNHIGEVIEFDAIILNVMNHDQYKSRFDYLIGYYTPDYEYEAFGPNFKIEDVNYYDFKIKGEGPDSISLYTRFILKAKILKFNKDNGLFFIEPIESRFIY